MYDETDIGEAALSEKASKTALRIEDLTIDYKLTNLERLKQYVVKSNIEAQRFAHVKMIAETCIEVGYEKSVKDIFTLFEDISNDSHELIRSHLALEISQLVDFFLDKQSDLLEMILPITEKLLRDSELDVRKSAVMIMISVFSIVKEQDILPTVLPVVLALAHSQEQHERETAVYLLSKLAELRGEKLEDLCVQFVVPELAALAEDAIFQVRRAVASNLAPSIKYSLEILFTALRNLVADPIWGVRRACAPVLPKVCVCIENTEQREEIVPLAEALLNDPNSFVRERMQECLGEFLAALDTPPDSLLLCYADSLPTEGTAKSIADVALAAGKKNWYLLDRLAIRLASCKEWKVEACLAQELGKLTLIAGVDRVCEVLDVLKNDRAANWRLRFTVAEQLPTLLELFDDENAWSVLAPLCFNLLDDPVKLVGTAAMESLGMLYLKFEGERRSQVCQSLLERSNRRRYGFDVRQQFVWIMAALRSKLPRDIFVAKFLQHLLELGDDPVTNVRIALAKVLSQKNFQGISKEVDAVISRLKKDSEGDVSSILT